MWNHFPGTDCICPKEEKKEGQAEFGKKIHKPKDEWQRIKIVLPLFSDKTLRENINTELKFKIYLLCSTLLYNLWRRLSIYIPWDGMFPNKS